MDLQTPDHLQYFSAAFTRETRFACIGWWFFNRNDMFYFPITSDIQPNLLWLVNYNLSNLPNIFIFSPRSPSLGHLYVYSCYVSFRSAACVDLCERLFSVDLQSPVEYLLSFLAWHLVAQETHIACIGWWFSITVICFIFLSIPIFLVSIVVTRPNLLWPVNCDLQSCFSNICVCVFSQITFVRSTNAILS